MIMMTMMTMRMTMGTMTLRMTMMTMMTMRMTIMTMMMTMMTLRMIMMTMVSLVSFIPDTNLDTEGGGKEDSTDQGNCWWEGKLDPEVMSSLEDQLEVL